MLSTKQAEFLKLAMDGNNLFLTGKAGTGKSFVLKRLLDQLKESGKRIMSLAPTGVAANNVNGQTIHSAFQLTPFGVLDYEACKYWKGERRKMMNKVDVFIIDEVSMLRPDILDGMNLSLIKNGCDPLYQKQIIFVGDMKQLPPIIDDNTSAILFKTYEGFQYIHAKVHAKIKPLTVELDEVKRQSNEDFINALNIVRDGGKADYFRQFVNRDIDGVVLAPHNSTVAYYNSVGLRSIEGEEYVYEAEVTGSAKINDFNFEGIIRVKDGCKIMYLVNSKNNNLFNGALGIFRMKNGSPMIEVGSNLYPLERAEAVKKEYVLNEQTDKLELREVGSITQYPFKLAYALSIHKSQGLTFDKVCIDLTQPCFQKGQLYVALSRVTGPEGLSIIVK